MLSRRAWIVGSTAGSLGALVGTPGLLAQNENLGDVLRSMSSLAGVKLDGQMVEPVASLVSAILEDSKPLRALRLGSIEIANRFSAE